jgi:hypothetical protein
MNSFDAIFFFRKKPEMASAFILEKRQGDFFAPLETENSNGEKVCYLTKLNGKANAKRKPSWIVSVPIMSTKKLGLRSVILSGVHIPSPEAANKGFGSCKYTGNDYLFLFGENFETLTILVFRNQVSNVQVLFAQFLDGEFDTEIAEFLESRTQQVVNGDWWNGMFV